MKSKKIPFSFYNRNDVVTIAKELLGKILITDFDGNRTTGRIVETEAYVAFIDKASHSFAGRRTAKNEHMYSTPGTSYVYICYGMHQMMNIITNQKDIPDAVLIRALEPLEGIDTMLERTGKLIHDYTLTRGPGNVGKAMGIFKKHSGLNLVNGQIFLVDDDYKLSPEEIGIS
ncbi:MAG: DNA-3-methyladenine glycosylase, partial [Chitinophagaceae bacterium]